MLLPAYQMLRNIFHWTLKPNCRHLISVRTFDNCKRLNLLSSIRSSHFNSLKMATKSALAILAPGTEEIELVVTVDVLRRAGVSNCSRFDLLRLIDR